LFEAAGGSEAFLRLATAHHERCLADPELNHPFSHPGEPDHVARLAAYWAEVFGGPPSYSSAMGDHSGVIALHSGNGAMNDLAFRFLACFIASYDDAGIPPDTALRGVMTAYMADAIKVMNAHPAGPGDIAADQPMPKWSWDGPIA
jgi:hemoglobin